MTEYAETNSVGHKKHRRERGQALVEMALVVPIFLILVLAIVDFGLALRSYVTITNAAREGARLSIVACESTANTTAVKDRVVAYSSGLLTTADVTVDADDATSGNQNCTATVPAAGHEIKVSATYQYNVVTPLGFIVAAFSGPITLSTSTTMRAEN